MTVPNTSSADPLIESGELFRAVFEASSDLMSVSRLEDGFCFAVNAAWLDVLGFERDEVIGKTAEELAVWTEPTVRAELIHRLKVEGQIENLDVALRGKDGRLRDCAATLRLLRLGEDELLLFSAHEAREESSVSIEQVVKTSRALLIDALESINEGFVLYDGEGELIICNSKFKEFYGYSDEEARPGVHRRDLGLLDIERNAVIVDQELAHDYVERREDLIAGPPEAFVVRLRDGRILLLTDRKTDSGGIVSIQSDITELKRAEAAISAAKDEAQTANRAKSEFLAHMSHELRTPLNYILGFTQIMREQVFGPLGDERYLDYAMNVNHSGQHLLDLINDILDISKVESGEVILDETVFDLERVLQSCIRMVTGEAGEAEDRIGLEAAADIGHFKGDRRIIKQVILNLLSNANKFTPSDKPISLAVTEEASGGISIEVADEGCGIARDDIAKVLEPFGQVRSGSHQAHAGTGLGLSLSKMLTELHGGRLSIDSELGEGTRVRLSFPEARRVSL